VAAWDWAIDQDVYNLSVNPWRKSLNRLGKLKLPAPKKVKPFSIDELRAIVNSFKNPKYSYYADAAIFISHTACRFGEMAALRWVNVSPDFETVLFSASVSRNYHRDTTKNGNDRTVVLPPTVRSMLRDRHQLTQLKVLKFQPKQSSNGVE
jgi:integrase